MMPLHSLCSSWLHLASHNINIDMNILYQGMAFYVGKDLGQGTVTAKDYDLYCHFGTCVYLLISS